MKLHELSSTPGARKEHYRKGRGHGSGNGKTAGKGHKGQNARSGGGTSLGFEGGQNPFYKRIPKRGFTAIAKVHNDFVVTLDTIDSLFEDGDIVSPETLVAKRVAKTVPYSLKIIGGKNEFTKKVIVSAHSFSKGAKETLEKLGGQVKVI
jgi:large subunit ribosomal protein L15